MGSFLSKADRLAMTAIPRRKFRNPASRSFYLACRVVRNWFFDPRICVLNLSAESKSQLAHILAKDHLPAFVSRNTVSQWLLRMFSRAIQVAQSSYNDLSSHLPQVQAI